MNVLMALEGVLRSTSGIPIREGISLYRLLCPAHRVVLCLDGPSAEVERWLHLQGLNLHDHIADDRIGLVGMDLRSRQIAVERAMGPVDLLIDPSPDRCSTGLEMGITTLLFLQPRYIRPEFQPKRDRGLRPWAQVSEALEQQRLLEQDPRLREPE